MAAELKERSSRKEQSTPLDGAVTDNPSGVGMSVWSFCQVHNHSIFYCYPTYRPSYCDEVLKPE